MKIEQRIIAKHKKESSGWHARTLGLYHCSEIYNIAEGKLKPEDFFKKEEHDDRTIFNFFIGHMYHDAIQKMYPKAKKEVEVKIELSDSAKIIGRCDLIVDNEPVELKSCSRFPVMPYDSHIYQFNCYLHALGYKDGFITYILKDPQEIKTMNFKVDYDKDLQEYIGKKVLEFHKSLLELKNK